MTVLDLTTLTLAAGEHKPGSGKMCLLEAVAYIAGEPWSDHPECVSPVLGAYGRSLNDMLPNETRQRLVPLIPRLLNTAGDGLDKRRSYMALGWLTRTYLPAWLRLVPALVGQAELIAAAPEVTDLTTATGIGVLVREAKSHAADVLSAVGDAAENAAGNAARDAAQTAAENAAGNAARDAAGSAAWDAARVAAGSAAGDVARDAAKNVARIAAWAAAWAAAGTAAGVDTKAFLAPTVTALQDSAIDLFDRMLKVTK